MAVGEIRVGDVGTQFIATITDENEAVVDVSGATTLQLIFKKPSGELLTKTASLYTDGTDGDIYYTSETGDLDECGSWQMQGYIVIGTTSFHSDIEKFKVHRNL